MDYFAWASGSTPHPSPDERSLADLTRLIAQHLPNRVGKLRLGGQVPEYDLTEEWRIAYGQDHIAADH